VPETFRAKPLLNFTATPALTVKTAPVSTVTSPVTIYGLPVRFHTVFAEIEPVTLVSAPAVAGKHTANIKMIYRYRERICFILFNMASSLFIWKAFGIYFVQTAYAKQSFADCIPKQSLGTRTTRAVGGYFTD
jgi:hypothetical protein